MTVNRVLATLGYVYLSTTNIRGTGVYNAWDFLHVNLMIEEVMRGKCSYL